MTPNDTPHGDTMQVTAPTVSSATRVPSAGEAPVQPPLGPVERHLENRYRAAMQFGPFVPVLLTTLALAAWFGLQTWLLLDERSRLAGVHASQQQTVDNATKLRASLDALAADTQRLADSGNANARLLVEELRRRGVTINPNPAGAEAAKK